MGSEAASCLTVSSACPWTPGHTWGSWGSLVGFGFQAGAKGMQDQLFSEGPLVADRFLGEIVVQGELATQLGELCIKLGLEVTQGWLWMLVGWPRKAVLWLGPAAQAEVAVQFLQDAGAFEKLQALVLGCATELRDLRERSIFQLRPVQQLLRAIRERGGQVTEDLKSCLASKLARFMRSQLAEGGFNISSRVQTLALKGRQCIHFAKRCSQTACWLSDTALMRSRALTSPTR